MYYNCREHDMKLYVTVFLAAGVVVPILLHVAAADRMPWWPDTVTTGIGFGFCGIVMVWKTRADRETNRRLWNALKAWGAAIGRHFGPN
jgi:hypothetical protein